MEYLILTDNILVHRLHSNLIQKSSHIDGFQYDLMIIQIKWLFIVPPCSHRRAAYPTKIHAYFRVFTVFIVQKRKGRKRKRAV